MLKKIWDNKKISKFIMIIQTIVKQNNLIKIKFYMIHQDGFSYKLVLEYYKLLHNLEKINSLNILMRKLLILLKEVHYI